MPSLREHADDLRVVYRDTQYVFSARPIIGAAADALDAAGAVLRDVETLLMIVEPRSHKAEYLALLERVRALVGTPTPPLSEGETK